MIMPFSMIVDCATDNCRVIPGVFRPYLNSNNNMNWEVTNKMVPLVAVNTPLLLAENSIECCTWIGNYIHIKVWDVITHPCLNFSFWVMPCLISCIKHESMYLWKLWKFYNRSIRLCFLQDNLLPYSSNHKLWSHLLLSNYDIMYKTWKQVISTIYILEYNGHLNFLLHGIISLSYRWLSARLQ